MRTAVTTTLDLAAIDYSYWMKAALNLAARGMGFTQPNPAVGAIVLDSSGREAGSGFHERAGGPHAETVALEAAGQRARGGTLVVTLEPCCHKGRTPPCTQAIIAAGIERVVAAHSDPDARVSGRGFEELRRAGVDVLEGIEAEAASKLNHKYLHYKRTGRPWVTLKLAMSLDGRISDFAGQSRWISSTAARQHAHRLRGLHEAILVGAGTALADDPELSLHGAPGLAPRRFVLVGRREVPATLRLFQGDSPATRIGVEGRADWVTAAGADGWPDPALVVERLGHEGITSLLVEGGGRVAASFLSARLVQQATLYYGALLLGEGAAALTGTAFTLAGAPTLTEMDVESFEGGFVVSGRVGA